MKKTRASKKWKVHYDRVADVLYIVYQEGPIERTTEAAPGVNLEFSSKKELVGIEILDARRLLKPALKSMSFAARK